MIDFSVLPYPVIVSSFSMSLNRMAALDPKKIEYCIWHHVGDSKDGDTSAASINNYHRSHHGWAGGGYHGVIRFNGNIELMRPLHKQGVHTSGYNGVSLAFVMSGNFEIGRPRPEQYESGVALGRLVSASIPGIKHVRHKDLRPGTLCNGKNFPWEQFINDIGTQSLLSAKKHIVVRGDTMTAIAASNGLSTSQLKRFNPHISDLNVIYYEYGGDIVFLEDPNPFEVEFAAMKRELILCKKERDKQ